MRIIKIPIQQIDFIPTNYSIDLQKSIERIGLSFPIKVSQNNERFTCMDGNKRLTILKHLNILEVNCIVLNNGNNRSNDCWRNINHH